MKEVAERLRFLRESVKLSQVKMAEIVGVKQSSLNRYELNQASPTFETLTRYADYFDVSMDYIFGRTDNPQGKLYEYKPKIQQNDPQMQKFVEMCFDPASPMNARLKETLLQMLGDGETMNVVIYARYSSHSQTEQSIEGQLHTCYEYARNNGYLVVGEYIDRAQSGTTDSRAEFQRMIADSDKHTFEGVLVYQLDRFARNRYDSAINKAKLKKNGVRVISARENISDDASGILVEGVLESMAEYYWRSFPKRFAGAWKSMRKSVWPMAAILVWAIRWIPNVGTTWMRKKQRSFGRFLNGMPVEKQLQTLSVI